MKVLFTILFCCTMHAQAAVYKCVVDGQTMFSGTPCAPDAQEVDVDYQPANHKAMPVAAPPTGVDEYISDRRNRRAAQQAEARERREQERQRQLMIDQGYILPGDTRYQTEDQRNDKSFRKIMVPLPRRIGKDTTPKVYRD
jgi:hypothetical protein